MAAVAQVAERWLDRCTSGGVDAMRRAATACLSFSGEAAGYLAD
jgi:hypothetical protein